MTTEELRDLATKTVDELRELGRGDEKSLKVFKRYLDEELTDKGLRAALRRMWLRPEIFLASALGSLLVGAASPEEFAIGTTASVVASVGVDQIWDAVRRDSANENLPKQPLYRGGKQPSEQDQDKVDAFMQRVAKQSVSWAASMSDDERRMEAANYKIVARNLGRPGPLGFMAMASIL